MNKKSKLKLCFELFSSFFKIGLFTFGGGMAMIPLIEKETVEKRGWIKDSDILEIVALSESTPGPIAINTATFIGTQCCGIAGAVAATLGVVLPSYLIILVISVFLRQFEDLQAVKYAFMGIRAGVIALVVKALIKLYKNCPKTAGSYAIMAAAVVASVFFKVNAILVVICAGLIGLGCTLLSREKGGERK